MHPLRELLADKGVRDPDRIVHPLVHRGHADGGVVIGVGNTPPELTVTEVPLPDAERPHELRRYG